MPHPTRGHCQVTRSDEQKRTQTSIFLALHAIKNRKLRLPTTHRRPPAQRLQWRGERLPLPISSSLRPPDAGQPASPAVAGFQAEGSAQSESRIAGERPPSAVANGPERDASVPSRRYNQTAGAELR